jgi:hypothetical protein
MYALLRISQMILLAGGVLSALAALVMMIDLAMRVRDVPNLPMHVRINPLNILARRDLWTPEIHAANRRLNVCVVGFIAFALLFAVITVLT